LRKLTKLKRSVGMPFGTSVPFPPPKKIPFSVKNPTLKLSGGVELSTLEVSYTEN